MCGRYVLTTPLDLLKVRFGFSTNRTVLVPRFNLAPSQEAPVVIASPGGRTLGLLEWGLVPSWAKDARKRWINARAETLDERPTFSESFQRRRGLVLADGFYEWRSAPGRKGRVPVLFRLRNREPFAFAGIWDRHRTAEGEASDSFSIITTRPNERVRPIHDRMPAILSPDDESSWLDPGSREIQKLLALLKPYPAELMESLDVSAIVNSPANDVPECLRPSETP